MDNENQKEVTQGYEIKQGIIFENDRGFVLAENPDAVSPFVTWQLTEHESGEHDYYWGHYFKDGDAAVRDYEARIADYRKEYGFAEKEFRPALGSESYIYYSTQRPVGIGTFPKTDGGPVEIVTFNRRGFVEDGSFVAWGYLVYNAPLTGKQTDDYELRPAPGNPDRAKSTPNKKTITEQLAEARKQVERDRGAPKKNQNKSHEDR